MNQLLPYLGVGVLLFVLLVLWARQSFLARTSRVELLEPRRQRIDVSSAVPHRDLVERVFGLQDWEFISREAPPEIQRMFQRERTTLVISWLRRARDRISQVMHAHVAAVRLNEGLQFGTEIRIALNYLLFLILCEFMVGLIWLRGPIRTRKVVLRTVRSAARLRATFERLMTIVDPASQTGLATSFSQGTMRS